MKPTVHACLESLLYEATVQFNKSKDLYEKAAEDFFCNNGSPDDFRKAKKDQDAAMQRLIDLETTRRILKEMEDKGIEL